MRRYDTYNQRYAFSLLELLVVIFIISFAYLLVFASMRQKLDKPKILEVANLRVTLLNKELRYTDGEFFCIEKSQNCYIYKNGTTKRYKGKLSLSNLEIYFVDSKEGLSEFEFGRYQGERISLRFKTYKNGSSSPMIIKNKKAIYYLPAFFGKTKRVDSLEKAKELWIANNKSLEDSSEYY